MADRPRLSVIIPCYFCAEFIDELVSDVHQSLESWADYEIILVNDGSTDDTWGRIQALCDESDHVRGIDLMRNFGQHNALFVGIREAQHETIVTMDDDLQHPPSQISVLWRALDENHDVVYGVPRQEKHGLLRDLASVISKWGIEHALGVDFASDTSAFRLFRKDVTKAFSTYVGSFVDIDALLLWHTERVRAIEVDHRERPYGDSSYTLFKLIAHAINMIVLFTTIPLRAISLLGLILTLFGVAVFAYVMGSYFLYGVASQGFTFLACITAIFGGGQLFAIGVLGEYLSRVHSQTMGYPPAVARREYRP